MAGRLRWQWRLQGQAEQKSDLESGQIHVLEPCAAFIARRARLGRLGR